MYWSGFFVGSLLLSLVVELAIKLVQAALEKGRELWNVLFFK
jgi:Na+-transporting NADH:ubiquinone oxidoreductase subunit NqrB